MPPKRRYTRYTPEVRQQAFELYLQGKTFKEIKDACGIGDTSGVAKIKRQDNWEAKKKIAQLQTALATSDKVVALESGQDSIGAIQGNYNVILDRRAEIATIAHTVAERVKRFLEEDGLNPKSLSEAWNIFKEATALEQSLMRVSVEEAFIMKVYEALKDEIEDTKLLQRVGERLKILILEEQSAKPTH